MFGKRKTFAPGTFIPTSTRVVAILQLSLAFTLICWTVIQPGMRDYFAHQSLVGLYKTVMGQQDLLVKADPDSAAELSALLKRNAARYEALDAASRAQIEQGYRALEERKSAAWPQRIRQAGHLLFRELNVFAQGWIFFSVCVSLMLLLRIEGAQAAAWLLPLLVVGYAVSKMFYAVPPPDEPDEHLFPTEQYVYEEVLHEPRAEGVMAQRDQLLRGFERFLVQEWAKEEPSGDAAAFALQVEEGMHRFNIARIDAIRAAPPSDNLSRLRSPESLLLLVVYFVWNLFFAWFVNRRGAID